jgi:hypothetical protein
MSILPFFFEIQNLDIKCNIQKQRMLQSDYDDGYQISLPKLNSEKDIPKVAETNFSKKVIYPHLLSPPGVTLLKF